MEGNWAKLVGRKSRDMRRVNRKLRFAERRSRRLRVRTTLKRLDKNVRASLTLVHAVAIESADGTKGRVFDPFCLKVPVVAKWFRAGEAPHRLAWPQNSKQVLTDIRIRAMRYLHRWNGNRREGVERCDKSSILVRSREWRGLAGCLIGARVGPVRLVIKEPLLFLSLVRQPIVQAPTRIIFICVATALVLSRGQERYVHLFTPGGPSVEAWSDEKELAETGARGHGVEKSVRQVMTDKATDNSGTTAEPETMNDITLGVTALRDAQTVRHGYQSSSILPAGNSSSSIVRTGIGGHVGQNDVAHAGIGEAGMQNKGAPNARPEESSFESWVSSSAPTTTMTSDLSSGDGLSDCIAHRVGHDRLNSVQLAGLLRTGWKFIARGDIATARVAFRRAAEACDTDAAFAMGKSYDPTILKTLGGDVNAADIPVAIWWYKKATLLGSGEAADQLALLRGSQ